jgi:hypothetical protein
MAPVSRPTVNGQPKTVRYLDKNYYLRAGCPFELIPALLWDPPACDYLISASKPPIENQTISADASTQSGIA